MISEEHEVTLSMRLHEIRNHWNHFHRPRLIAEAKALPRAIAATWSDIRYQLRLALLVAFLGWVTRRLQKLTEGTR
jgi:hypothetical protein